MVEYDGKTIACWTKRIEDGEPDRRDLDVPAADGGDFVEPEDDKCCTPSLSWFSMHPIEYEGVSWHEV
jgi:hypothetical protein